MKEKFPADGSSEGIKVAFKLPDGTKIEYNFSENSTVKVSNVIYFEPFNIIQLLVSWQEYNREGPIILRVVTLVMIFTN